MAVELSGINDEIFTSERQENAVTRPHILHVHSTFSLGGKEARAVRLMNAFGDRVRHSVISSVPGALGARDAIDGEISVTFPGDHPPLTGRPAPHRFRDLARYLASFDLVLTYNWGAMDAVMARRLHGGPALIHHEDGFNSDEAVRQKLRRILFRKTALPGADMLVVPSEQLQRIARTLWGQPDAKVQRIANGIATANYALPPTQDAIPGLRRAPGELVVGTLAGLRPVKNLRRLVRSFAAAGINARLVIVGEGEERNVILAEAARCGVTERIVLPGFLPRPERYVGLFDIFALSSDSEQFPISVVEAMAAGLPVVATDVGDIRAMVSRENRAFIVPVPEETDLAGALRVLASDAGLRALIGRANQIRARAEYAEDVMIGSYAALYGAALRTELAPA